MRFFLFLLSFLFSSVIVFGEDVVVGTPSVPVSGPSPAEMIVSIYRFSLSIAGFLAFGIIVYAGLRYTWGGDAPSVRSEAREMITQAFLGIILLVGAAALFGIVNNNLNTLVDPHIERARVSSSTPSIQFDPESVAGLDARCQPIKGFSSPASEDLLKGSCFGSNYRKASAIARAESNGDPTLPSGSDVCRGKGSHDSVSWGLFQINLTAHTFTVVSPATGQQKTLNCTQAFNKVFTRSDVVDKGANCWVTDYPLYNECKRAAQNPVYNIEKACRISNGGSNWNQWGAYTSKCRGPAFDSL